MCLNDAKTTESGPIPPNELSEEVGFLRLPPPQPGDAVPRSANRRFSPAGVGRSASRPAVRRRFEWRYPFPLNRLRRKKTLAAFGVSAMCAVNKLAEDTTSTS